MADSEDQSNASTVVATKTKPSTADDLRKRIGHAAFAFRGYNVTNLGRSPEILEHPAYGPVYLRILKEASEICSEAIRRRIDLVARVRNREESSMETYAQDVALIVATELAHVRLLEEFFDVPFAEGQMVLGYSLGEVSAVVACGVFDMAAAMTPMMTLARDCVSLAHDVTMGILFSRGPELDFGAVQKLCLQITSEGYGQIAVSSFLAPNTALLLGQGETVEQFKQVMHETLPKTTNLRKNPNHWPPLHTPILRQANIPDRAGVMMDTASGGFTTPSPRILSCVTGDFSYNDFNSRDLLTRWVDHPQLVWNVIDKTLASGVEKIIHVGPEPNIIPATFLRLSNNVSTQLNGKSLSSLGLRAMSQIVRRRRWLTGLLSSDATLLRAPFVDHIILEDWLLEQEVR